MQLDWEIWLDCNISPAIAKRLKEKTGWNVKSAYVLELFSLNDPEIYFKARQSGKIILVTKDSDLPEIIQQKGAPPKLIYLKTGNCNNKILWQLLQNEIEFAVRMLTEYNIDIIEIT